MATEALSALRKCSARVASSIMNIKLLLPATALLSVLGMSTLLATAAPKSAGPGLDIMDRFIGTWVLADEEGNPTDEVMSEVRKTAGASVVMEVLMPGTPNEMITMYYMDGDQLKLTHYCACTNHPILAASINEEGDLRFDCTGTGENFAKCATTPHMHDAVYRFEGKDRVHTAWRMMDGGELGEPFEFHFVRQPAPIEEVIESADPR